MPEDELADEELFKKFMILSMQRHLIDYFKAGSKATTTADAAEILSVAKAKAEETEAGLSVNFALLNEHADLLRQEVSPDDLAEVEEFLQLTDEADRLDAVAAPLLVEGGYASLESAVHSLKQELGEYEKIEEKIQAENEKHKYLMNQLKQHRIFLNTSFDKSVRV